MVLAEESRLKPLLQDEHPGSGGNVKFRLRAGGFLFAFRRRGASDHFAGVIARGLGNLDAAEHSRQFLGSLFAIQLW